MSNLENIRWGVLGLGWFGEVHADTLSTTPGIELAALCTRTESRLNEFGDRYGVDRRYTDYHRMLEDDSIDVIGIVTHIDDHRDIAIDALEAGKNVFLEKPMAPSVEDCDMIIEAARRGGGKFMVGHVCRFDPRVTLAKQAIEEGRVGKIISMHARRNLTKAIGLQVCDSISALFGDGIHDADLMLWFSGAKAVSVYGQEIHPDKSKYPEGGFAMARLDDGAVCNIESVWYLPETTPYAIDARMEVIGTEGAIYINCGEAGLEIHDKEKTHLPDTIYWPTYMGGRHGALPDEFRYFADCVRYDRQPDRITPEESRAAVELMVAAGESARTGKIVEI
ncbi:MAG: Gfo/Idh/MocA family oxidoreductase [Pirellulales bacterium]|nr:Gfo/Idh/MocA family oxidoreductase [Pirellulales bacterium]